MESSSEAEEERAAAEAGPRHQYGYFIDDFLVSDGSSLEVKARETRRCRLCSADPLRIALATVELCAIEYDIREGSHSFRGFLRMP